MQFSDFEHMEIEQTYSELHGHTVNEYWKQVPEYDGRYSVSSLGRIRNNETGEYVNQSKTGKGYRCVSLSSKRWLVHRLVMFVFEGTPKENRYLVRHINDIKHDNRLCNLCYGNDHENRQDLIRNSRRRKQREDMQSKTKVQPQIYVLPEFTSEQVKQIRRDERAGLSSKKIAQKYNIEYQVVRNVIQFRTYSYLVDGKNEKDPRMEWAKGLRLPASTKKSISQDERKKVRKEYRNGASYTELAEKYETDENAIKDIIYFNSGRITVLED